MRASPAVITTTFEPRSDEKSVEPLTSTSTPVSAIFWEMSIASPSASPGTMSTSVTSSIPAEATSSAAWAPTRPAPRKPIMCVRALRARQHSEVNKKGSRMVRSALTA